MRSQYFRQILFVVGVALVLSPERGTPQPASAKAPAFEVASIRENTNPNQSWRMEFTPDGLRAMDVTLEYVLHEAFGVYDDRLWAGEPKWIAEKRFDIVAKFDVEQDPHPTLEQRRAMLQRLLADRLKVAVHHEQKDFALYALVLAKHGRKFKETKAGDLTRSPTYGEMCTYLRAGRGTMEMRGCSMADLASGLSNEANLELGRKVIDETGLTGRYDMALHWTPVVPSGSLGPDATAADSDGPALISALKEQLGLELKSTRGPLDTIVVDHIEMPSEN